jgi:hypothetical protein
MNDKVNDARNDKRNDGRNDEGNDPRKMLTYRILRYLPNLVRDEWVNIGVLLEDRPSGQRAIKLIEEDSEFARVRRLNPAMDDSLLRGLGGTFDAELRKPNEAVAAYLEKLDQTLSMSSGLRLCRSIAWKDLRRICGRDCSSGARC